MEIISYPCISITHVIVGSLLYFELSEGTFRSVSGNQQYVWYSEDVR